MAYTDNGPHVMENIIPDGNEEAAEMIEINPLIKHLEQLRKGQLEIMALLAKISTRLGKMEDDLR